MECPEPNAFLQRILPLGFSLAVKYLLVLDLHKVFKIWDSTQPHTAQQPGMFKTAWSV